MSFLTVTILFFIFLGIYNYLILPPRKNKKKQSLGEWVSSPFTTLANKFLNNEKEWQEKLDAAGMSETPLQVYKMKIALPTLLTITFVIFSFLSDDLIFRFLILLSISSYFAPDLAIAAQIKKAKKMRIDEFPEFTIATMQMLETQNQIEALKQSRELTGPYLLPYVNILIAELEQFPSSDIPLRNFTKKIDIPEAHTFALAMIQFMKTDRSQAIKLLRDQIKIMRKLQKQNHNLLIKSMPDKMVKYIMLAFASLMMYFFIVFFVIMQTGFNFM